MSNMEGLGLPDHVVDLIMKQNGIEGAKLEWTVCGREGQVELKLKWRAQRGPREDHNSMKKQKSQGNIKRDYFRMKRRLAELNSVCVGTDDMDLPVPDTNCGVLDACTNVELPISAPKHQRQTGKSVESKSKVCQDKTQSVSNGEGSVRTQNMRKQAVEEVDRVIRSLCLH